MKHTIKNILRNIIGQVAKYHPTVQHITRNGFTIFTFHDVGEEAGGFSHKHSLCTPPKLFKKQIDWIDKNFSIIDPQELTSGYNAKPGCAIITFDDGWHGIFENALPILASNKIPSVIFMNMAMAKKGELLISAIADFLGQNIPEFLNFALCNKLSEPYHLSLSPKHLSNFEKEFGKTWHADVPTFQGLFATPNQIEKWDGDPLVNYGNHLYNHWNACALTKDEFIFQFEKNEEILKGFKNYIPVFAFPNGQPGSCFTEEHVNILNSYGIARALSTTGTLNSSNDSFLLDRIALTSFHKSPSLMWYAISRRTLLG